MAQLTKPGMMTGTVYLFPQQIKELDREYAEWVKANTGKDIDVDDGIEVPVKATRPGQNIPVDPVRAARLAEAIDYIKNYTGTWGFILDLRADRRWGTKHYRLSDRQVEVVLNSKARDAARAKERVQTGRDLTVLPIGRTRAAVDNDSGGVTFLIIDRPAERSKWAGWVFVKQQQGPNEVRLGSQRPNETYAGQWANLIQKVIDDPMAAVARRGHDRGGARALRSPVPR